MYINNTGDIQQICYANSITGLVSPYFVFSTWGVLHSVYLWLYVVSKYPCFIRKYDISINRWYTFEKNHKISHKTSNKQSNYLKYSSYDLFLIYFTFYMKNINKNHKIYNFFDFLSMLFCSLWTYFSYRHCAVHPNRWTHFYFEKIRIWVCCKFV